MKIGKIKDLYFFHTKSKIKAGEGLNEGTYPFYTSSAKQSKWLNDFIFNTRALVFGTGGSASLHLADGMFSVSTDCFVLSSKQEEINIKYTYYYLNFNIHVIEKGFQGAGLKHISKKYIENIEIIYPDLEYQNKIVEILDKAKTILDKREEMIAGYNELLQATFLDMFGDPYFNKKNFLIDSLENLCFFITKGSTPPKSHISNVRTDSNIPFLKVYHISERSVDFFQNPSYISLETHMKMGRSKVIPNDVIMNIVGPPLGKIGIVPDFFESWNINQAIVAFRPKDRILSSYLLCVLQSKNLLLSIIEQAIGVRQLNLSLKQCRAVVIPVPPIELQAEFDEFFLKYNKLLMRMKHQCDNIKLLILSLSQQIFSEKLIIDIDAELDALINAIDLEKKDEENKIDTIKDITLIQKLADRLKVQDFEDKEQYDKAKYILFRIMREEENLIRQVYVDNKVQLTLLNETS